nr:ubiquitin carboxyl-terminal hydrolase 12-like [Coffea arabica]
MESSQKPLSITMGQEKSCKTIGSAVDNSDVVQAVVRKTPPSDYTLKIDSFSFLLEMLDKTNAESYSSKIFEASGYYWKLHLYPRGDIKRNGLGFISFYASIHNSSALPLGWQINANIEFFVYDQIRGEYLVFQDVSGEAIRLNEMKKEWGTAQLLDLKIFHDPTNGFLLHDKCAFGLIICSHCLDDIKDSSKGYLVKDTLIVEAEVTRISTVNDFSSK